MGTLGVEARLEDLELAERFTIARQTWTSATSLFVKVTYGGAAGWGEVQPADRWEETPSSALQEVEAVDLGAFAGPFDLQALGDVLPAGSARCALDIAFHDLAAKLAGISLQEYVGLGRRRPEPTSVTVPIADPTAMVERTKKLADYPIIKTKVGFEGDVDAIRSIRRIFGGRLRVDANEGWEVREAIERLKALEEFDIELCEQPIQAGNLDGLRQVREASPIPVYADEDVCDSADVARLHGSVDGVNLKLRKTGGLREFIRCVAVARALGMGVMIGCDLESGIAITAGASVAPLADFVDLDGPLLLAEDPYPGVEYDGATLVVPEAPGLGLRKVPW
jgi:L-alanine-DL-glutamate epimerase-like enolase superfamily enzyme